MATAREYLVDVIESIRLKKPEMIDRYLAFVRDLRAIDEAPQRREVDILRSEVAELRVEVANLRTVAGLRKAGAKPESAPTAGRLG